MPRPSHTRLVLATALAATLVAVTTPAFSQSGAAPGRWACTVNGKEVEIRIAGAEATVAIGGERRVLKQREARSGTLYTDGTVALRQKGPDPTGETQWIENGQASSLSRCLPIAG